MNKISTEELFKIAYNHLQNKNYIKSLDLIKKAGGYKKGAYEYGGVLIRESANS